MNDQSKDRAEHRGQPVPHLGADHYEKSQLEARAKDARDDGTPDVNPAVSPAAGEIGPTGIHPERIEVEAAPANRGDSIINAGSDPDGDLQRTGGSPNDPDGGHELAGREWRGPDPDPVDELVIPKT